MDASTRGTNVPVLGVPVPVAVTGVLVPGYVLEVGVNLDHPGPTEYGNIGIAAFIVIDSWMDSQHLCGQIQGSYVASERCSKPRARWASPAWMSWMSGSTDAAPL